MSKVEYHKHINELRIFIDKELGEKQIKDNDIIKIFDFLNKSVLAGEYHDILTKPAIIDNSNNDDKSQQYEVGTALNLLSKSLKLSTYNKENCKKANQAFEIYSKFSDNILIFWKLCSKENPNIKHKFTSELAFKDNEFIENLKSMQNDLDGNRSSQDSTTINDQYCLLMINLSLCEIDEVLTCNQEIVDKLQDLYEFLDSSFFFSSNG